jgi:hypothetical protein
MLTEVKGVPERVRLGQKINKSLTARHDSCRRVTPPGHLLTTI